MMAVRITASRALVARGGNERPEPRADVPSAEKPSQPWRSKKYSLSSAIWPSWDKSGPLTRAEVDGVRLHTLLTQPMRQHRPARAGNLGQHNAYRAGLAGATDFVRTADSFVAMTQWWCGRAPITPHPVESNTLRAAFKHARARGVAASIRPRIDVHIHGLPLMSTASHSGPQNVSYPRSIMAPHHN